MANAGRVLILAKGAWVNTTNYSNLDLVTKGSTAYLARQSSIGVDPSTDSTYTYWQPFGSSATIATTSAPGLVMPDGTSITVDNTGLIKAALGVNDLTNVSISTLSDGQVLKYNSSTLKWENKSLGTAASKNSTNAVTQSSTDLVESGAVYSEISSLNSALSNVTTPITATLSVGATSVTISNARITTTSVIDPYTDTWGLNPTDITVTTGQCVLTFEAQDSAHTVGIIVR